MTFNVYCSAICLKLSVTAAADFNSRYFNEKKVRENTKYITNQPERG